MPVRNEAWILGLSARVALMWCDRLVLLDHASTDASIKIMCQLADEFPDRVAVMKEVGIEWDEMRHRQAMLARARYMEATHIAIIDADEVLTGDLHESKSIGGIYCIRTAIESMPRGHMLQLPGYNLRGSLNRYHANGIWGNRWFSVAFADDPRLGWSGDNFHSRDPIGAALRPYRTIEQGDGGVVHLWGASERRLRAKHALYKITERLRWPDKPLADIERMYSWAIKGETGHRSYGTPDTWTYADVPASWWAPYAHLMQYLDVDAEPWQEKACIDLVKEHGPRMFQGLDLFGVCG